MNPKMQNWFGGTLRKELIDCLQACYTNMQEGNLDNWLPDPYFEYHSPVTTDLADRVIDLLDKEFEYELKYYPDYHLTTSGSTNPPDFNRLPEYARIALVQRLIKIASKYEDSGEMASDAYLEAADEDYLLYGYGYGYGFPIW